MHLEFYFSRFIFECSSPANIGSTCKNDKPEDLRTKVNLLLYGHLYVVALLICAFVLMGEKHIYK